MATIKLKNSGTAGAVPTAGQLTTGEVAVNRADGAIFLKDTTGAVVQVARKLATSGVTISGTDTTQPVHSAGVAAVFGSRGAPWRVTDIADLAATTIPADISLVIADRPSGDPMRLVRAAGGAYASLDGAEWAEAPPLDKAPSIDWAGKTLLWIGTSIPAEGMARRPTRTEASYPEIVAWRLDASVENKSFAGSHAYYDHALIAAATTTADGLAAIKCLSMTAADVTAGLAALGASSPYSDAYDPNGVTLASQMTADARIKPAFVAGEVAAVFIDHNHNDRGRAAGTTSPPQWTVTAVSLGATTTLTVSGAGLSVGDFIACRISGIGKADYLSARVSAVAGSNVTVGVDSSTWTGTFTSGSLVKLDRGTICGALEAIAYLTLSYAAQNGRAAPALIFAGAPSAFTNGAYDERIESSARACEAVAAKWGHWFDVQRTLSIPGAARHTQYFADLVHPTTASARRTLANLWVEWLTGGAVVRWPENALLIRDEARSALSDGLPPIYDALGGGFATRSEIEAGEATALTETWASGLTGWTTGGTAPTVVAAPWNASESALLCSAASGSTSYATKGSLTLDKGITAEFDLYLAAVEGLTATTTPKTVDILLLKTPAAYLAVELIIKPAGVVLKALCFQVANASLVSVTSTITLSAATKHRISLRSRRATAGVPGAIALYLDGMMVAGPLTVADSAQSTPSTLEVGIRSSNTGAALTLYIGQITLERRSIYQLYTGPYPLPGTATVHYGRVVVPA